MALTQAEKTKLLGLAERYVAAFEKSAQAAREIAEATVETLNATTERMKKLNE